MPAIKKNKIVRKVEKGFSLIELLIAIVIVGIISTVGIISYSQAQKLGRDAKRKQDLASLAIALELYYQKNKYYPPPPEIRDYNAGWDACVSSAFTGYLTAEYIKSIPEDPFFNTAIGYGQPSINNWCYYYYKGDRIANRRNYTLYARLENPPASQDPNLCTSVQKYRAELTQFNYCLSP